MANFSARWERAREAMKEAGLSGLLLTTEPSVYYFSGTMGSRPPGLILTAQSGSRPILVCRDGEKDTVAAMTDLEVIGAPQDPTSTLLQTLTRMGLAGEPVGFEDGALTYAAVVKMQTEIKGVTFRPASDLINRLRILKDADEIALMHKAGKVSDLAMMAAVNTLRAGGSETIAAAAAESTMRQHGMFIAYETLIGSGFRSGMLRRYPNFTVPGPDDVIKIDLAAKLSFASGYGYHTDQTRSITTGAPSKDNLDALKALQAIQEATLAALKPGKTIREVSLTGLSVVKGTKYESICTMSGHGIGLDIHEWPHFGVTTDMELAPGQCFAIEPHLVVPATYTMCFEDTLVITDQGYDRITHLPYELWG